MLYRSQCQDAAAHQISNEVAHSWEQAGSPRK